MSPGGEEEKLAKKRNCQKQEEKYGGILEAKSNSVSKRVSDGELTIGFGNMGVGGDHDKHCISGQEGMKACVGTPQERLGCKKAEARG